MKYTFSIVSHKQCQLFEVAIWSIYSKVKEDLEIILTINSEAHVSIPEMWRDRLIHSVL